VQRGRLCSHSDATWKSKTRKSPARAHDTFRPGRSPLPPRSLCPLSLPPLPSASCLRLSARGDAARPASSSGLLRLALRRVPDLSVVLPPARSRAPFVARVLAVEGVPRREPFGPLRSTYAQDATAFRRLPGCSVCNATEQQANIQGGMDIKAPRSRVESECVYEIVGLPFRFFSPKWIAHGANFEA
jgi:hypothetical protein